MPTIGNTTKPSGPYGEAFGAQYNQAAELVTMPERGEITRLGQWMSAGQGSTSMRLCLWRVSDGALLGQTGLFTVLDEGGTYDSPIVSLYEADLVTPVIVDAGVDLYVGLSHSTSKSHILKGETDGAHVDKTQSTWPGNMNNPYTGEHGFAPHRIGSYVANYNLLAAAWLYRPGPGQTWVRANSIKVYRSGAWVDADAVQVRRSGAWVDAG